MVSLAGDVFCSRDDCRLGEGEGDLLCLRLGETLLSDFGEGLFLARDFDPDSTSRLGLNGLMMAVVSGDLDLSAGVFRGVTSSCLILFVS